MVVKWIRPHVITDVNLLPMQYYLATGRKAHMFLNLGESYQTLREHRISCDTTPEPYLRRVPCSHVVQALQGCCELGSLESN